MEIQQTRSLGLLLIVFLALIEVMAADFCIPSEVPPFSLSIAAAKQVDKPVLGLDCSASAFL